MADAAAKARRATGKPARPVPGPLTYVEIFRASPTDRIRIIREGVAASTAKRMIADLHFDQGAFLGALNLKVATVNRKAARHEPLAPEDGERVIGIARLVGQVEAMLEDAGTGEGFDAAGWLAQWLRAPLPALGGLRPVDLVDTMEGQSLVSQALAQVGSGAYA